MRRKYLAAGFSNPETACTVARMHTLDDQPATGSRRQQRRHAASMRRRRGYLCPQTVPYGVHVRDSAKHQNAWGAYLAAAVTQPGWSVARLAREAGISRSTIFRWMSGEVTNVTTARVRAVAEALGDDVERALQAVGAQNSELRSEELTLEDLSDEELLVHIRDLVRQFDELTAEQQRRRSVG